MNYLRPHTCLLLLPLTFPLGCDYAQYNARLDRATKVLQYDERKRQALGELWTDEDLIDDEGTLVRAGTQVRYQIPKPLDTRLTDQWGILPSYLPAEAIRAVYGSRLVGKKPGRPAGESEEKREILCFIAVTKSSSQDNPITQDETEDRAETETHSLHQQVRELWQEHFPETEALELTRPQDRDFGPQRKFEVLVREASLPDGSAGMEDPMIRCYLYPPADALPESSQIAVYFEIGDSIDPETVIETVLDNIEFSLETIGEGPVLSSSSEDGVQTF